MEFELNIEPSMVNKEYMDEWGAAYLWLDDNRGVEYNLAYDSGECCSAIYKTEFDGEYLHTDDSIFEHYEIDFEDQWWRTKLMDAMYKVAKKFFRR